jgi:hypothetical protein
LQTSGTRLSESFRREARLRDRFQRIARILWSPVGTDLQVTIRALCRHHLADAPCVFMDVSTAPVAAGTTTTTGRSADAERESFDGFDAPLTSTPATLTRTGSPICAPH